MPATAALLLAILGQSGGDAALTGPMLRTAFEREMDPLDYCVFAKGVSQALATQRCAQWLGVAFFEVVPTSLPDAPTTLHLEALADVRTFRVRVLDRDVLFCSPRFFEVLRLKAWLDANPDQRRRICLVPERALRDYLVRLNSQDLLTEARQRLARRWPASTADLDLPLSARIAFVVLLLVIVALVLVSPFLDYPALLPVVVLVLLMPAVLRLASMFCPTDPKAPISPRPEDAELPVYSILIPLRDEAHMVPQLVGAMVALDYPADRLDIKFVVEGQSSATIAAVKQVFDLPQFSLVVVPDAMPRTKPKALDYALPLLRGEFVVVFDAEDRPDSDQLWRVAQRFRESLETQCVQAQLVVDNGNEAALAALFAGEYAGLFGVQLPALARWRLPVPLGGTSNHFRVETLRAIGGWDAYNVTEDADLGVRLARLRHRVDVMPTRTLEEAPTNWRIWLGQRTRWMKGWMQTLIVHNRHPRQVIKDMGWVRFVAFELTVICMIGAPLLHSAFLLLAALRLGLGLPLIGGVNSLWGTVHLAIFVFGYGVAVLQTIIGLRRLNRPEHLLAQAFLPLYWLLISLATLRALYELLKRPFHWAKTPHRVAGKASVALPGMSQKNAAAPERGSTS